MASNWLWASASVIGSSHLRSGTPKQDAFAAFMVKENPSAFCSVVCDGAGSTRWGGVGAYLSARIFKKRMVEYFKEKEALPDEEVIWEIIDEIRDRLFSLAMLRDTHIREFSTTFLGIITDGADTVYFHIGDGSIVIQNEKNSLWESISWPEHGEYASTTNFITESPAPKLKFGTLDEKVKSIALFSDGIERLALNFEEQSAHAPFFNGMFQPLWASTNSGHSENISSALSDYLSGEKINSRTDDDKTLVMAVKRKS